MQIVSRTGVYRNVHPSSFSVRGWHAFHGRGDLRKKNSFSRYWSEGYGEIFSIARILQLCLLFMFSRNGFVGLDSGVSGCQGLGSEDLHGLLALVFKYSRYNLLEIFSFIFCGSVSLLE